jgi:hypothetical protein
MLGDALKGWGPGILVGLGAAIVAPAVIPGLGGVVRPVAKALIVGCLAATNAVSDIVAEAKEQLSDLVAEARAEQAGTSAHAASASRSARPAHA